ncbi:MAG TPA: polyprenyl synthetase [Flavobacteriales bacterium]|nr:polyprenyl synthetase [Flavobacteriales bacterium]
MNPVDIIKKPIEPEMKEFELKFKTSMQSKAPLLDRITHYIIKRKGKQLRPMFVFLSAKATGDVNESTYTAAALIELLHTATLVHDDVVDEADERRGFFSVNALWKNKIAVLVGDFLLSKGLMMAVDNNEFELLHTVSDAVKEMSEGELLQMEKTRLLNFDEEVYFEIIRQKTAALISACCRSGAQSTKSSEEHIRLMTEFGEKVGMAFQIKDDLFDYGAGKDIGKPTGIDIQERKTTLPLIYALNRASNSDRKRIVNIVKNHNTNAIKVKEVIQFVSASGGIEYATQKMHDYARQSLELLSQLPETEARKSLETLVNYTIERER